MNDMSERLMELKHEAEYLERRIASGDESRNTVKKLADVSMALNGELLVALQYSTNQTERALNQAEDIIEFEYETLAGILNYFAFVRLCYAEPEGTA